MAVAAITAARCVRWGVVGAVCLLLAACGSRVAVDPTLGVAPSERVAREGEPMPRGGGREHVGRPYTIAGRTYHPRHDPDYSSEGLASWYGAQFHGRRTANGEIFDRFALSAAHTTMPLPSYARVTNLQNNRSIIVRVNDRGPFHGNRVIDVSRAVADTLDFRNAGVARVRVDYVGPASTAGSDDEILMATLRTDGQPAQMPIDGATSIQIAEAGGVPRAPLAAADRPVAPTLAFAAAPPAAVAAAPTPRDPFPTVLPPQRPSDLPTAAAASLPGAVPATRMGALSEPVQLVGIFFADPDAPVQGFTRSGPFEAVAAQPFATLRRTP